LALTVARIPSHGSHSPFTLMINFLLVQIIVLLRFDIEPKKRRLEGLEPG
jgi:hypothetical protein